MQFKKWLTLFISFFMITGLLIVGFNYLTDPFGVFGDRIMNWYAYNMTNNPRVSKIKYIDDNHEKYDSYIIGCSKTSSFDVEKLNEYYGAKFYNMIMYGGDMYDIEATADYLINNYEVKNLIIGVGLEETRAFDSDNEEMKNKLHAKVRNESLLKFYTKYLFLNPKYGYDKVKGYLTRSYLSNGYDVFVPEKGNYNKATRDVESIANFDDYRYNNPGFENVYDVIYEMKDKDKVLAAVKRVKDLCDEKNINFKLVECPLYYKELEVYDEEEVKDYWTRLADITDFWNFAGYSILNCDERYYYDVYHFRNTVGDMALAKMFNDESKYVVDNFGYYITKDNKEEIINSIYTKKYISFVPEYCKDIPILMYHHIVEKEKNLSEYAVTVEKFRNDMEILNNMGYNTVVAKDLINYVEKGIDLPSNPIMITFDDGYYSNYEYAYPILKDLGMKATISIVGTTVGSDIYNGMKILEHFNYEKAKEMYDSGVIDIGLHSYDMHTNDDRIGVLKKYFEPEEEYIKIFRNDIETLIDEVDKNITSEINLYAYPYGNYTPLQEVLVDEYDIPVTLSVKEGKNQVVKGLGQSLKAMRRYNVTNETNLKEILK